MTYYAALDVALRSAQICVIDDDGKIFAEGKTDSEAADIVAFLDELKVSIAKVGLEAGTLTQYLAYGLQFAGFEVVCMEARQVKNALSAIREAEAQPADETVYKSGVEVFHLAKPTGTEHLSAKAP